VSEYRYRIVDSAGSELGIVSDGRETIREDDEVSLPDGTMGLVLEVYDDEHGREGGVVATLVVDEDAFD
jgi:hypothetical protein